MIHAVASASSPYGAWLPVTSWSHLLGLDETTGDGSGGTAGKKAANSQWSKVATRLVDAKLIRRGHGSHKVGYTLLDEDGSGAEYVRPTDDKVHGTWFSIPHAYWLEGWDKRLELPGKAMLLIALSSSPEFRLPLDYVQDWYGVSKSTARRGLKELLDAEILEYDQTWRESASSPTGWAEVRTYFLLGKWSHASRIEAMKAARRGEQPAVEFTSPEEVSAPSEEEPQP